MVMRVALVRHHEFAHLHGVLEGVGNGLLVMGSIVGVGDVHLVDRAGRGRD